MEADMSPEMASRFSACYRRWFNGPHQHLAGAPPHSACSRIGGFDPVEKLLEHARVAKTDEEQGWARFEALKVVEASLDSYLRLAEETERMEGAQSSPQRSTTTLPCSTSPRVNSTSASHRPACSPPPANHRGQGRHGYGMALLMAVAKRQHDEDTAIAVGTERLELLISMKDDVDKWSLADLPLPGHHR